LKNFYQDFKNEALVVDKCSASGGAMHTDCNAVRKLMTYPAFTAEIPTCALQPDLQFCNVQLRHSSMRRCSGYAFWTEQVIALKSSIRRWAGVGAHAGSLEKISPA